MGKLFRNSLFRVGDWVEVLSEEEILATLDDNGRLEGLPFMPEMFAYCGQRFRVFKRAHKTCDTVFPIRSRRMEGAVHLATRCEGTEHGGCQAGCLIFWKDAWLKPVAGLAEDGSAGPRQSARCTRKTVFEKARISQSPEHVVYACQATQLPYATTDLRWWDMTQYVEDYLSGNVSMWQVVQGAVFACVNYLAGFQPGEGRLVRRLYDALHPLWRGTLFPWHWGKLPVGSRTPSRPLNLKPGELVRVRSHREILETLTIDRRNRGLYFDAEMVPHCGRVYHVQKVVSEILDERTGMMLRLKEPAVILDGVFCESRYAFCRMLCPRAIYSYWREIWLERIDGTVPASLKDSEAGENALPASPP